MKSKSLFENFLYLIFFLESEQSNLELDDVNSMKIAVEERHPKFHRDIIFGEQSDLSFTTEFFCLFVSFWQSKS